MNNVKEIGLQIGNDVVALCYGSDAFKEYYEREIGDLSIYHIIENDLPIGKHKPGELMIMNFNNNEKLHIFYINNEVTDVNIIKTKLVYMASEYVNSYMRILGIMDDKIKSRMIAYIYGEFSKYLDEKLFNNNQNN